jgi:hypothetical protein
MVIRGAGVIAAVEPASEVVDVAGDRRLGLKLVDDGQDVVERGDGVEGWSVGWSERPAGGDEGEGVLDGLEGHSAIVELACECAIGLSELSEGSWGLAIGVEHALDIDLAPAS